MRYLLLHIVVAFVALGHLAQAGEILPEAVHKELNSYVGKWEGKLESDKKSSPALSERAKMTSLFRVDYPPE